MKTKFSFVIPIIISFFSCNQQQEQTHLNSYAPKVVEAKGYIVPKDSMATPKSVSIGKLKVVRAGKPAIVPIPNNIHLAGVPTTVIAGTPKICTPGKDSFQLPKVVRAIIKPFPAGIPEVVIAGDAIGKDQNLGNFISFTKRQGIKGDGSVPCLLQDKNGNIWFGTWNGGGVARYDGKNFTNFTKKEGLNDNTVLSICEDRSGNLWFGTQLGGISKYDGKTFTNFTTKEGLSGNYVSGIVEDRSGNLWIGTEGGISRLARDGNSFTNYTEKEGLANNFVGSILQDKAGNIWFGTGRGVSRLARDGNSFANYTEKEGLANNFVGSILQDKAGNLWFGTGGGVSRLARDGNSFTNYSEKEGLSNNSIPSIAEDRSGNLWFATHGDGVYKFDGNFFTHFTEQEGLVNNRVLSILKDRSGCIWIGSEIGLSKYNGGAFSHFTREAGLSSNDVRSFCEDKSGDIWFGTTTGVSIYDGKTFTHFTTAEGLIGAPVESMFKDRSGNLWFSAWDGISRYDGTTFTNFPGEFFGGPVASILEDSSANIWFSNWWGNIYKFDGRSITQYTTAQGLSNDFVQCMAEDDKGKLWFGTNRGVSRLDRDGKTFTHFTVKEGLSGNKVGWIIKDTAGNFWIETDGGVSRLDRDHKTFTNFTKKEVLGDNDVESIFLDRSGNLWLATAFGLNKLSSGSLLNLSANARTGKSGSGDYTNKNPAGNGLFKSYSYEDGFLGIGCNPGAIFEDKTGTMWIGTRAGLTAYHPEGDKADTIPPNMQLTGIALFNENIPWANLEQKKDTNVVLGNGVNVGYFKFDSLSRWYNVPVHLSLAYNNNFLTFNFIGITTKSPKGVKYQYKLEGLDANWSTLTNRTEAAYGNLPPDSYIFEVKAMNSDGYWSKEFDYSFTIRPPWWRTWLAYTLYVLALVGAVSWFIAYRSRKLRLENKILEEKVTQRTIQLEQKSTELEKSLDNLKSTQAQLIQSEKMASLGELTAGIAHEIQNPLNFVNNFSEVNKELIEELKIKNEKLKIEDDEVNELLDDIKQNLEKINHHGKRADAIVKGMLQHSKASTGNKELTDINKLADEYLRLSYHGMRAKDKSFNATMKTDFDKSVGTIDIIPQDVGRVILNLINNAFYAVNEKAGQNIQGYEPTVSIVTKKIADKAIVSIADNGNGIPQKVLDKIFQPFFTTKPTGQGTGLGLSLSYDIVKVHGGEIKVETREGKGSEFIIQLPLK